MAGLAGNVAYTAASRQTAKGAIPASVQYKNAFTGGSHLPERPIEHLNETDASRDQGDAFVTRVGASGAPELYVRNDSVGLHLLAAQGGLVTSGAGADKTHTFTMSNAVPYMTFWRMIGDLLWERSNDCLCNTLTIRADAGMPLTVTQNFIGRSTTRLTADPAALVDFDSDAPFSFNEATVTVGGGATSLVSSFELTIENSVSVQQTDDIVPYDVVAGKRNVTCAFDMLFETLDEYNKFHYGGAAGTVQDDTIYTTPATFLFTKSATNELSFSIPTLAYEEFPVEPDAGGDPIVVSARGSAQRQVGGASLLTTVLENQVVSYPAV